MARYKDVTYFDEEHRDGAGCIVLAIGVVVCLVCFFVLTALDNMDNKFVVKDKVANSVLIQHKKIKKIEHLITFSQAYQDSIVYSNINIGDKLVTAGVINQKETMVSNSDNDCTSRITHINGKKTKKMIEEYERQQAIAAQMREKQMLHQYMQTQRNQAGRN